MNQQTLRYANATDARVARWPAVAAVDTASFAAITGDRLKAFKTRFSPSAESFGQQLENLALTAGFYIAAAAAAVAVSTANLAPVLRAVHLNVV